MTIKIKFHLARPDTVSS